MSEDLIKQAEQALARPTELGPPKSRVTGLHADNAAALAARKAGLAGDLRAVLEPVLAMERDLVAYRRAAALLVVAVKQNRDGLPSVVLAAAARLERLAPESPAPESPAPLASERGQ